MPSRRPTRSLTRRKEIREPKRVIKIYCEGLITENQYLAALRRVPEIKSRTALNIEIVPGKGMPLTLVELAVVEKNEIDDREIGAEEYWCVFDVEWPGNHPNLLRAKTLAETSGVNLAISNPCFELWLILHCREYQESTAFMDNSDARAGLRQLGQSSGKHIHPEQFLPYRQVACDRAKQLARVHERAGSRFPDDNPSSGMYRLIETIERP